MSRVHIIHFVCRGNVFRSRLAEAYFRSLGLKNVRVSSSGIESDYYYGDKPTDYILPCTVGVAKKFDFAHSLGVKRTQTTEKALSEADIIVFMKRDIYDYAKNVLKLDDNKALIWNIKDFEDYPAGKFDRPEVSRFAVRKVIRLCQKLAHDISSGGWVDIVDENNKPMGLSLSVAIANEKGLFHRGCHVLVTTPSGGFVIEKRSKNSFFSPHLVDITLGGISDEGETSKDTAVREMKEELGIEVAKNDLENFGVRKISSYRSKRRTYHRRFVYIYHYKLKTNDPDFSIQRSEVAEAKIISKREVKQLVKKRYLRSVGRLNYSYAFYEDLIDRVAGNIK